MKFLDIEEPGDEKVLLSKKYKHDLEEIRRKRLEFFERQDIEGQSLVPKESPIQMNEVEEQESMPENFVDDFDMIFSVDHGSHHRKHSEQSSDIAARLLLPKAPFESNVEKRKTKVPETRQSIRARLSQKPKLFDVSDFSSEGSLDPNSLIVDDVNDQTNSFCEDDDDNNSESDVDARPHLFDISDFELTGDRLKNTENCYNSSWCNEDEIRERLLQGTPSDSSVLSNLPGESASLKTSGDFNESARVNFEPVKSRIDDASVSVLEGTQPESPSRERGIDFDTPGMEDKKVENTSKSMKSRIDNIRKKLQQKQTGDSLTRGSSIDDVLENPIEHYESRIQSIREKLQQKKPRRSYNWSLEISHEDIIDNESESKQLVKSMQDDLDTLDMIENGSEENGSIGEEEQKQVFDLSDEFAGMAGRVPNGNGIKVDSSIVEDEIKAEKLSKAQISPLIDLLKANVDASCVGKASSNNEQNVVERRDVDRDSEELIEERIKDQQEIHFDMLESDDSHNEGIFAENDNDQQMYEPINGESSLRDHLGLNSPSENYLKLSLDEEDVSERPANASSHKEEELEVTVLHSNSDDEISTDNVIEPENRPPLYSIVGSTEESIEILDMLDKFESGIEVLDECQETGDFVRYDSETSPPSDSSKHNVDESLQAIKLDSKETIEDIGYVKVAIEDKYNDLVNDAERQTIDDEFELHDTDFSDKIDFDSESNTESDDSSSRSILRSPLTKGHHPILVEAENNKEEGVEDLLNSVNTDDELQKTDFKDVQVSTDLLEDPVMEINFSEADKIEKNDVDHDDDGKELIFQTEEEQSSNADFGNEVLEFIDFDVQELVTSEEQFAELCEEDGASEGNVKEGEEQEPDTVMTSQGALSSSAIIGESDSMETSDFGNADQVGLDDEDLEKKESSEELSVDSSDNFIEQVETLEIVDFNLCRESSFVNEAVIVELSHEEFESKDVAVRVGDAADLREEYRARADLQNLPEELVEHLPLDLSPMFALNSVTLQDPFIGETSDSDSQSNASHPGNGLSDSEEEIEFGPGKSDVDRNENVIKDEEDAKELQEMTSTNDDFSNANTVDSSHSSENDANSMQHNVQEENDSLDIVAELENKSDENDGINFTNDWFENSKTELDYVSSRLDSSVPLDESGKNDAKEETKASESQTSNFQVSKSSDTIFMQSEDVTDFQADAPVDPMTYEEIAPTEEKGKNVQLTPSEDSSSEDLKEFEELEILIANEESKEASSELKPQLETDNCFEIIEDKNVKEYVLDSEVDEGIN